MKTFKVASLHDVEEDNWEDGTGKFVNSYALETEIKAENWKEALKKYMEDFLCYDVDMDNLEIDEETNVINYSVLVDENNSQFTDEQYDLWKKGNYQLYDNTMGIKIYENSEVQFK